MVDVEQEARDLINESYENQSCQKSALILTYVKLNVSFCQKVLDLYTLFYQEELYEESIKYKVNELNHLREVSLEVCKISLNTK